MVKNKLLHCVVIDVDKKEIQYNPVLAMIRFETGSRLFVYQWDLKKPRR
jgi:hypothetical protein